MRPPNALFGLLPVLSACAMDYGVAGLIDVPPNLAEALSSPPPSPGLISSGEEPAEDGEGSGNVEGEPEISVRLDAAFQRNRWGSTVTRCQVQLSFSLPNEAPTEENTQNTGSTVEIARPEEPGTCAFTSIDPDSVEDGGHHDDNWFVSGTLSGPEEIFLVGDTAEWTLELVHAEDGQLRYELPGCDVETFPFGQALDLVVPYADEDLGSFEVIDALAVGSEVVLTSPHAGVLDPNGSYRHGRGQELELIWDTPDGEPVLSDGSTAPAQWELRLQNAEWHGNTYQWLYCMPEEDGRLVLPAEVVEQLHFNAGSDEETVETSLDLHAVTDGQEWTTPWGSAIQVRTTVSDGGALYLDPEL